MKKTLLKSMLTAVALTMGTAAWAQTDVTAQYLANADFSQSTPIDNHLCGYGKDMAGKSTTYYGMQEVAGWTINIISGDNANADYPNSGLGGAVFAYGSEWQLMGNNKTAPATDPKGNAQGNALGFFAVWGCGAYYYQDVTLPAGVYKLTFPIYNQSGTQANQSMTGFFPNDADAFTVAINTAVGKWVEQTVTFTLENETAGKIFIGYKSTGSGSGANPMLFFDGVKIEWSSLSEAAKIEWQEALQAAKDAQADEAYANVAGNEKAALDAAINSAEPTTAAGYEAATAALKEATAAFTAAKAGYDAYAFAMTVNVDLPYADPEKKPVAPAVPTTAADAQEKANALLLALRAYYESNAKAETEATGEDLASTYILNYNAEDGNNSWTWTGNKNNPRNTETWTDSEGNPGGMYFDGGNWGATGWTTTMEQEIKVPAGKYLLTAKGRSSEGVTLTMSVGDVQVELPHVGAAGNVFDRGWGDGYVEFESPEGDPVTILIKATTAGLHEWFSIGDFRLMQLDSYVVEYADANDYSALAMAILTAQAKVLGFDQGEYAPYNNIAALEALNAAKAINANEENSKKRVTEATAALNGAQWTANAADVDIVFNGMFETVTEGANYPLGWTRTNGWGQMQSNLAGDFATAYYNQPGSLQYGNQGAYLMPLKAGTYTLSLNYHSHENNSNNGVKFSVLDNDGLGVIADEDWTFVGNPSTSEWAMGEKEFTLDAPGNYILSIINGGNTWMTNVKISRSDTDGIENVVSSTEQQGAVYNLSGQRVVKVQKGLYIQNGKKYVK